MNTPVDKLFQNFENIKEHFFKNGQLDYLNILENDFRKNLLISSASYIETSLQEVLINFVDSNSNHRAILHFLKNKAIARQYHSYFSWEQSNINSFLGLFGSDFRDVFKKLIEEQSLSAHVKSFLELGRLRNELVHQNFIVYSLEKTSVEIKKLFDEANHFVEFFDIELKKLSTNK